MSDLRARQAELIRSMGPYLSLSDEERKWADTMLLEDDRQYMCHPHSTLKCQMFLDKIAAAIGRKPPKLKTSPYLERGQIISYKIPPLTWPAPALGYDHKNIAWKMYNSW